MKLEDYFSQPQFAKPRRLILSVEGGQKVGKTTLAMSAIEIGPIALIDYDFGGEGVLDKYDQSKMWHLPLLSPVSMLLDESTQNDAYKVAWDKAKNAYYAALADPRIRTIVIDTASEFREAQLLAHFGRLSKVMPRNYGEPNAEMRKLIRAAYERPDINFILLHTVKDEYVDDTRTGVKVFSGFNGVPGLVQMVVRMWKRDKDYGLTIVDCRHKRSLEGAELPAAAATFPQLLNLVHGVEE
jgi:hypothetical protein